MSQLIGRVQQETAQVEAAVEELKLAQSQMDNNAVSKLKQGGIVKQGTLAGFLLFAGRSLVESVTVVTGSNNGDLGAALVQGVIAMACAAYFFLV